MEHKAPWIVGDELAPIAAILTWGVSSMGMIWLVGLWSPQIHPATGVGVFVLGIPFGAVVFVKLIRRYDRLRAEALERSIRAELEPKRKAMEVEMRELRESFQPSPEVRAELARLERIEHLEFRLYALLATIPPPFRARKYVAHHQQLLHALAEYERHIPLQSSPSTRKNMDSLALRIYRAIGLGGSKEVGKTN